MQTSPDGIALIKKFEGCRLAAYPDPGTGGAVDNWLWLDSPGRRQASKAWNDD